MKGLKKPTGCIVIGTDDVWHKTFLDCFLSHDEIEIASSIIERIVAFYGLCILLRGKVNRLCFGKNMGTMLRPYFLC